MNVEERVTTALRDDLDRLEVSPGDPRAAITSGGVLRRRRTALRGVGSAAAVGVIALSVGLGLRAADDGGRPDPAPAPPEGWTELPKTPLSARTAALAFWTGDEAIFLGGEIDHHCPPGADCVRAPTYAKDGAAYDPDSETWRRTADAPATVASSTPHAVVGDVVVLVTTAGWFGYDASENEWNELPDPPLARPAPLVDDPGLSVLDGKVYSITGAGVVQVLDVAERQWDTLPESRHQPALEPHWVAATPEGIVVLGVDSTARNDGTEPSLLLADVFRDGSWQRLAPSEILGGWGGWHWTGERLVSPYAECLDGGEVNNFGRCIPTGGALDPGTGTWAPLDPAPQLVAGGWSVHAADGPLVATWGYLYDDTDESWTLIDPPESESERTGMASVLADGRLISFGGIDWSPRDGETTNRAWVLTP